MGSATALAAFGLSLLVVLAASGRGVPAGVPESLDGLRVLPLALLPWVALAGLPPGPRRANLPGGVHRIAGLALGLPILALAARLDHGVGVAVRELATVGLVGLSLAAILALAAPRSPGHGWSARAPLLPFGLLWSGLVLLPPMLELVLVEVARGRGPGPPWPGPISAASPLGWLGRRAAGASDPGSGEFALLLCALLLVLARLTGRDGSPSEGR